MPIICNCIAAHRQRKEYLLSILRKKNQPNNIQIISTIFNFDEARFISAIDKLLIRHESLRTKFDLVNGEVNQIVLSETSYTIVKKIYFNNQSQKLQLKKLLKEEKNFIFDLQNCPLFRICLIRSENNKTIFIFTIHHIISDGISLHNLEKDFISYYETEEELKLMLNIIKQNRDFSHWEAEQLSKTKRYFYKKYWEKQFLKGIPNENLTTVYGKTNNIVNMTYLDELTNDLKNSGKEKIAVATNYKGTIATLKTFKGNCYKILIPNKIFETLKMFALDSKTTCFTIILANLYLLIYKLTNCKDVVIAMPISLRKFEGSWDIVGWLMGAIICKYEIDDNMKVIDFINNLNSKFLEAVKFGLYPCENILLDLDISFSKLVPIEINYIQNNSKTINDFQPKHIKTLSEVTSDINVLITEYKNTIELLFYYKTNCFEKDKIEYICQIYIKLLNYLLLNKNETLIDIDIL